VLQSGGPFQEKSHAFTIHFDEVQLYAITDRSLFASREALLACVTGWSAQGVDYVQIREKDLDARQLETLACEVVDAIKKSGGRTSVLLNGPAEIAVTAGCDGIHLPSKMPAAAVVHAREAMLAISSAPIISVSCHTLADIEAARQAGASLAVFAPVFEKLTPAGKIPGQGLHALGEACRVAEPMPVFALGGVDEQNARGCIDAGAAGIAAIRLFVSGMWGAIR